MTKTELINAVAEKTAFTKTNTKATIDALIDVISDTLVKGEGINLVGFANFTVKEKPARTGRNPLTGKNIEIPAKKVVNVKIGKELATKVNA